MIGLLGKAACNSPPVLCTAMAHQLCSAEVPDAVRCLADHRCMLPMMDIAQSTRAWGFLCRECGRLWSFEVVPT